MLQEDADGAAVILDVKYQPPGAVHDVLSVEDEAWYGKMFQMDFGASFKHLIEHQKFAMSFI